MSQENVEMVRGQYEAWRRGNFKEALSAFDQAVEWDATHFPDGEVYVGHDGVQRFMRRWVGTWEDCELEVERLIDAGDDVVIFSRERGRAKGSGIEIEHRFGHVFTVRNRKIVRWRGFTDRAKALEAVGLSE